MNINKVIVAGRLTRDPEMKALPSGASVTNFSLAVDRKWKDGSGNQQEAVEFINIVVFGKQAEISAQYLTKGQVCLVEGRLQTRSWEKDGVKNYRTEVVADRVQFGARAQRTSTQQQATQATKNDDFIDFSNDDVNPEDVPY